MKGLGTIFFFLLIGMLAMVSIWLFFIFFKIHVTGIAIDVNSINRYQEIPTVLLSSTFYENSADSCHPGDGPAGPHALNENLCKKNIAFYYSRSKATDRPIVNEDPNNDGIADDVPARDFLNNIRLSLPLYCYKISFRESEEETTLIGRETTPRVGRATTGITCSINQPKINEIYPMPIFSGGVPSVAEQILLIGSSTTTSDRSISNWPVYDVEFRFGGS
jgi:hypothetical protein